MFVFCYDFIWGMTANARHAMTTRRHCGMIIRLWNTFAAGALIAVTLIGADAWAQSSRTIRIVVPFPAGGSATIVARLLGDQISKAQGPTVLIENRPGGGASIAYEAVARGAGRQYARHQRQFVCHQSASAEGELRPAHELRADLLFLTSPQVIVVNSASPYGTLNDLISAARAKPGELSFASVGPATTQHIGLEQFKRLANINVTYVPYTGGAPAMTALLGGHVTAGMGNYSEAVEQLNAGTLRALASCRSGLRRCPMCRRWRSWASRITRWRSGSAWSTGENSEGDGCAACHLVQVRDAGARGQTKTPQPWPLSSWLLRRRLCGAYPQAVRHIQPHHSRGEH